MNNDIYLMPIIKFLEKTQLSLTCFARKKKENSILKSTRYSYQCFSGDPEFLQIAFLLWLTTVF